MSKYMICALFIAGFSLEVKGSQKGRGVLQGRHKEQFSADVIIDRQREFDSLLRSLGVPLEQETFFERRDYEQQLRKEGAERAFIGCGHNLYFLSFSAVAALDAWMRLQALGREKK